MRRLKQILAGPHHFLPKNPRPLPEAARINDRVDKIMELSGTLTFASALET